MHRKPHRLLPRTCGEVTARAHEGQVSGAAAHEVSEYICTLFCLYIFQLCEKLCYIYLKDLAGFLYFFLLGYLRLDYFALAIKPVPNKSIITIFIVEEKHYYQVLAMKAS
jgi:hypothetical protein